jgi:hypothetical protein
MGTRLNENASYDSVLSPNPLEPVRAGAGETIGSAAYTIQGINVNGDLNYTPQVVGVRIKHLGGISMALSVTVAGSDITVQLATDGSGNVTSTANAVKIAYDAVAAAVALAVVQVGGTGAGLAGVFSSFMPLTDDAFGSVRPSIQTMMNNDSFMYSKVYGILNGTVDPAFPAAPNQRSLKALYVDGTGDNIVTATSGEAFVSAAYQAASTGVQNVRLEPARLQFRTVGTGAGDGNPPLGIAMPNELRPILIPKAWGFIRTNGVGGFTKVAGAGFTASFSGTDVRITLATAMYTAVGQDAYAPIVTLLDTTLTAPTIRASITDASHFLIKVQDNFTGQDLTAVDVAFSFSVFGIHA